MQSSQELLNKLDKLLSETSKPSSVAYAEDLNDPTYTVQYELFEKVCASYIYIYIHIHIYIFVF